MFAFLKKTGANGNVPQHPIPHALTPVAAGPSSTHERRALAARYDILIHLIGRPADGKTTLLISLAQYLYGMLGEDLRDQVRITEIDALLSAAIEEMKRGRWPAKTPPTDSEVLGFKIGDLKVGVVCHPGEILRVEGAIRPERIEEIFGPGQHIFVVVLNVWRYNRDLARKSFLGLIATLQAAPLNHNLVDAARIAFELLFGYGAAAFEGRDIDHAEILAFQGTRIEWSPASSNKPARFTVRVGQGCPAGGSRLFHALNNYADFAVDLDLDLNLLRQFARRVPGVLIAGTRMDLRAFIPAIEDGDFDSIFDEIYGPTNDFWASQRILAKSVSLTLRPDPLVPTRVQTCIEGGRALHKSILRTLVRMNIRPATGGRVGRFFRALARRESAADRSERLAGHPGESLLVVDPRGRRYSGRRAG